MPLPREVSDIQQHGRVVDIAAGRRHTLVLILDDTSAETKYKAFGFGANELHQLGLAEDHPAAKRAFVVAPVAIRPLETFRAFKVLCAAQPLPLLVYFAISCLLCRGYKALYLYYLVKQPAHIATAGTRSLPVAITALLWDTGRTTAMESSAWCDLHPWCLRPSWPGAVSRPRKIKIPSAPKRTSQRARALSFASISFVLS